MWLKLTIPTDEYDGFPLEDSAGLYEPLFLQLATEGVRDLMECVDTSVPEKAIAIGHDGLIGDHIVLWTGTEPARVVVCTNDEPGQLLEARFDVAPSFEKFMERFLGASQEGREKITFWMD